MEDLLLAFVTSAVSIGFMAYLAHAGMDAVVVILSLASIPIVGYLAYERGRSQRRWIYLAVFIGPLAVPLLYFVSAISSWTHKATRA
jgi:uncharacterized metal-binding protein